MGYWNTTAEGGSLQVGDTDMLWGDQPADIIDEAIEKLIERLTKELGRYPTVEELDALKFTGGKRRPPELEQGVDKAIAVFAADVGRLPSNEEIEAGLRFSSSEIALDSHVRRDYSVGDRVRWADWDTNGFFSTIAGIREGVIEDMPANHTCYSDFTVRDSALDDLVSVQRAYLSKVLKGDPSIEETNARYKGEELTDEER
jgi:hypothetical protein